MEYFIASQDVELGAGAPENMQPSPLIDCAGGLEPLAPRASNFAAPGSGPRTGRAGVTSPSAWSSAWELGGSERQEARGKRQKAEEGEGEK